MGPKAWPEASRAIGRVLVSVIPGDTLTSRKCATPASSTIRSVRDRSRSRSTEWAAIAIRATWAATSPGSRAGT